MINQIGIPLGILQTESGPTAAHQEELRVCYSLLLFPKCHEEIDVDRHRSAR